MRKTVATALVTFVIVLTAVFIATVGIAVLSGEDTGSPETADVIDIENEQYDVDRFDIDDTLTQADISLDAPADNQTIVIHAGVGALERDVQTLTNPLTAEGHEVRIVTEGQGFSPIAQPTPTSPDDNSVDVASEIKNADAFVSVGAGGYDESDIEAIEAFAQDGGRVLLMTDPQSSFNADGTPTELQSALGVFTEPGYIYNLEENDLNYQRIFIEPVQDDDLAAGVDMAVFDTAAPVGTGEGSAVLAPIEGSELSTTRDTTDLPVLVRNDNAVLIGDTKFISPENALRADNAELIGNLLDFLVTGEREHDTDGEVEDFNTEFGAVNTGGLFAPNAETEQEFRNIALEFPAETFEITAEIDDNRWESTAVEVTPITEDVGEPVELAVPDGFSGELNTETDRITVEGTIVLSVDDVELEFNVSATSGESGKLSGSADLDATGGSAVVVDNEFTVASTGDAAIEPTEPGLSWFELELDLQFDSDAIAPRSDDSESADDGTATE